jgi:hypothetical protein
MDSALKGFLDGLAFCRIAAEEDFRLNMRLYFRDSGMGDDEIERTIDDLIKLAHDISERWTPQKE